MAFYLPLTIHRNGAFRRRLAFTEPRTGVPIDLTGATFVLRVRRSAGAPGSPIATASIIVEDAPGGIIEVTLLGSAFSLVEGTQDIVTLAYDLVMTQGGVPRVLAEGPLTLKPGVS
jgi:hypothetical protein